MGRSSPSSPSSHPSPYVPVGGGRGVDASHSDWGAKDLHSASPHGTSQALEFVSSLVSLLLPLTNTLID